MMTILKDYLQRQIDNLDKIPDNAKMMIINKSDLKVVATLDKASFLNYQIEEEYLNKGIESCSQNKSLGCAIVTIADIPDSQRPMFV